MWQCMVHVTCTTHVTVYGTCDSVHAGQLILRQGKLSRSMYFVRTGFVDLVMDGAVVDTIQAGDYFGEVALLALPPTHELLQVQP